MFERLPVLGNLFLGETLGVSDKDLVLGLVEGPVDGGKHLSPAGPQALHGELTVGVVENQGSLNFLDGQREREDRRAAEKGRDT